MKRLARAIAVGIGRVRGVDRAVGVRVGAQHVGAGEHPPSTSDPAAPAGEPAAASEAAGNLAPSWAWLAAAVVAALLAAAAAAVWVRQRKRNP